jgi:hypothetical protein
LNDLPNPFIVDDDDLLVRGDIIARGEVSEYLLCLELFRNNRDWGYPNKTATHGISSHEKINKITVHLPALKDRIPVL